MMVGVATLPFSAEEALAACVTVGQATSCTVAPPNPSLGKIGTGPAAGNDGRSVTVDPGAELFVTGDSAISLRDNATINISGIVRNNVWAGAGDYGSGLNTISVNSLASITVNLGGQIIKQGTLASAEAINLHGFGNVVLNNGLIRSENSATIWFEDSVPGARNRIENHGRIERVGGVGSVIGASGQAGIIFDNYGEVIGALEFANGDDDLRFFAGSVVTGSISGGGGQNALTLDGQAGSNDILPGALNNFQTVTKTGDGRWDISGSIVGFTSVSIRQGTLALTGDNAGYIGDVTVDPGAILESQSTSLPTNAGNLANVVNNGLVHFIQAADGTYVGQIVGTGAVLKTGTGILTLLPDQAAGNTYAGGTTIREGTIAVGADSALGAATGGLTFDGGTLRLDAAFDLAATRAVTLDAGGGTIDTQAFTSTLAQGITGAGAFTKAGDGTLILTGDNVFTGGTTIAGGTLRVGNGADTGSLAGNVANAGVLEFNRAGTLAFDGIISGTGTLVQAGSGSTVLGGANTYNGVTQVLAGALRAGGAGVFSPFSTVTVAAGAQMDLAGHSQTIAGLTNAGLVSMGNAAPGTVLTVNGNILGQGGVVAMNTVLAADDAASDRIVLNGGMASGTTGLRITNAGGGGAATVADGIRLVEVVGGGSTEATAFGLTDRLVAGAYEYLLFRGDAGGQGEDWYLRNTLITPPAPPVVPVVTPPTPGPIPTPTPVPQPPVAVVPPTPVPGPTPVPLYRPEVPLYAPATDIARRLGVATLGTLHERVGEEENIRDQQSSGRFANGAWTRAFGQRISLDLSGDATPGTSGNLVGVQAGVDLLRGQWDSGHRDHAGLYLAFSEYSGNVDGFAVGTRNLDVGRMEMQATSLGAYWTHFGPSGWYVDVVAQGSWLDGSARSDFGTSVQTDGFAFTGSVEAGLPITVAANLTLEPQAQLIWNTVSLDDTADAYSTVSWEADDTITARVGARLQYTARDGQTLWQPYAKVNLWHGFRATDEVRFGTSPAIRTDTGDTSIEAGVGVTAKITSVASLYAHADYTQSLGGGRTELTVVQASAGLRFNW